MTWMSFDIARVKSHENFIHLIKPFYFCVGSPHIQNMKLWNTFPNIQITVYVNSTKLCMIHSFSFHILPLLEINMKVQWIRGKITKNARYTKKPSCLFK